MLNGVSLETNNHFPWRVYTRPRSLYYMVFFIWIGKMTMKSIDMIFKVRVAIDFSDIKAGSQIKRCILELLTSLFHILAKNNIRRDGPCLIASQLPSFTLYCYMIL